jgi:hypothetical protein
MSLFTDRDWEVRKIVGKEYINSVLLGGLVAETAA